MNYSDQYLKGAHKLSFANRSIIKKSTECGCFSCCTIFPSSKIKNWSAEHHNQGDTGWCPSCDIDSIIGDAAGIPVTREFLEAMNKEFFGSDSDAEVRVYESFSELVEDHLKKKGSSQLLSIHHRS